MPLQSELTFFHGLPRQSYQGKGLLKQMKVNKKSRLEEAGFRRFKKLTD
jgi:hypothetical protein